MAVVNTVATTPFDGQRPGTSGLRKKTRVFMQRHYVENFVQSVLDVARDSADSELGNELLIIGGDGRFYNRTAIQAIIRVAAANGFGRISVGRHGILSTPAMSAVIRRHGALGGLVLTASHNPGGVDGDFGIKYNIRNGGPAPEGITEPIYERTQAIERFMTLQAPDVDLDREHTTTVGDAVVKVIDPLDDYTALMKSLFDFDILKDLFAGGFRLAFDAMHGVTGPYARYIFEELLGAPSGTVTGGVPLEDFGGGHPDPNQVHAAELVRTMGKHGAPDFGAACDGDGDRNMILGRDFFVSPGDSLAVIVEHARNCIPGYRNGLAGVARSMPTSTAADRVARSLGIPCFETPTGWKFFGTLMDAGLCTLCGEESFGTGSDHVREKDGIWAVLCWLSILASTRQSVETVVRTHWTRFGRSYYQRHDFENLDPEGAGDMVDALRQRLSSLRAAPLAGSTVVEADDFSYMDPVDGSRSSRQGIRIMLEDGSRIVLRLSGTGTEGATLRVYLEGYRSDGSLAIEDVLAPLRHAAIDLLELTSRTGRKSADVVT